MTFRGMMTAAAAIAAIGTGAALAQGGAATPTPAASPPAAPAIDRSVMHVQVILDSLGFTPGVIDGQRGQSLTAALRGFQTSRDLPVTGEIDRATLRALYPYRNRRPTVTLTLSERALAGPYFPAMPKDLEEQARLPAIGYRSPLEKLAEMFHTTPETIVALNSRETMLRPGTRVVFPNVLPTSRAYGDEWKDDWRQTLGMLNVDANQPEADRIVVDKSDSVLRAYAGDRLVAQFSATMGSQYDPLPLGNWTIKGTAPNPTFHYNPDLFWDADATDEKATLQPGPNGPVGVVWIDLSKDHYGIHGTPEPRNIGRTESHGCIRLTNWDAARLALMVKPGTPATFQS